MKTSFSQLVQTTALAATLANAYAPAPNFPSGATGCYYSAGAVYGCTFTAAPVTSSTPVLTVTLQPVTTSSSTGWSVLDGVVTVTSYRTVTDYCGCGIPGVSTIGPILTSTSSTSSSISVSVSPSLTTSTGTMTTTSTTSGANTVNPTLGTTSTSFTSSGSTVILPPATVTTSLTTTTNTNVVSPTLISTTSTSSSTSTAITTVSTTSATTTTTVASSTTTNPAPIVTDQAYINTILRHHNVHRTNHTAPNLVWSPSLAATAQKIAASCNYGHNTAVDGGGYGQNIGAGYPSTAMGQFVTEGLYNPEVNSYTYYGGEPDTSTVGQWGHMSQIVWVNTGSVGCYTQDCSATGLSNTGGNIPPFFTVCNYSPAGNVVGAFGSNVLRPVGNPTVFANFGCPSAANCV